ncbi:MAG: hypothetical protein IPP72_13045 [Chitinophagaceae bacterium]|nr:hypothetical protein [Chitinophagaceae bacterium]
MLKTLTLIPLIFTLSTYTYAQLIDLTDRQQRIEFEPASKNTPAVIRAAKISTEKIYSYYQNKAGATDSSLQAVIEYDTDGYIAVSKEMVKKNRVEKTYSYFFNSNGLLIKKRIRSSVKQNSNIHYTEIDYNEAGLETFKYDYDNDSINMIVFKKEYNDRNQCVCLKTLDTDGSFKVAKEYTYNKDGSMATIKWFFYYQPPGPPAETIFIKTERNGNSEKLYLEDNQLAQYEYDSIGRCIVEHRENYHSSSTSADDNRLTVSSNQYGSPFYIAEEYWIPAGLQTGNSLTVILSGNNPELLNPQPLSSFNRAQTFSLSRPLTYTRYYHVRSGKEHFYNDNGTINETAFFSEGDCIAISKHFYQTK